MLGRHFIGSQVKEIGFHSRVLLHTHPLYDATPVDPRTERHKRHRFLFGIRTNPRAGLQIEQLSIKSLVRVEQEKYELLTDEKYPLPMFNLGTHLYG